jgi:uncharacterized membrane protein
LSYVGHLPTAIKIVAAYMAGLVVIYALNWIPPINRWLNNIESRAAEWARICCGKKRAAGKCILILIVDILLAFAVERLIASCFYKGDSFYWGRYITAFVVLFLVSLFIFYRSMFAKRLEFTVFLFIVSIGSIFSTTLPASTGVSWDDEVHYNNSLMISHFFDKTISKADDYILSVLPYTAIKHQHYDRKSQIAMNKDIDSSYRNDQPGITVRVWPRYKRLCYVPMALGLLVGRALQLPYHLIFITGRLFNLLFYAMMVYFALKKLKSGKMIAAVVALLPFNVFMAANYSYDPWITAWLMYGTCCFFGELQQPDKKMRIREWILMLLAFFIGVGPKVIYIPLMLITLAMPKQKYRNKMHRKIMIGVIAVITLLVFANFLLPFVSSSGGGVQDNRGGANVNAAAQTAFILGNPLAYTKILLKYLLTYISFSSANNFMTYFHYASQLGITSYAPLIVVTLLVVTFTDKSSVDCNVRLLPRALTILMSFGAMCLVATSMYIAYTAVGSNSIAGCQYRYLAPVMFPVLYCLGSGKIENKMKREYYNGVILAICSWVLINAIWTMAINIY